MKKINNFDSSVKNIKNGVLYNCHVVKRQGKDNSIVELKRIGGKRPKYVDWDSFNELRELVVKIANKVGV